MRRRFFFAAPLLALLCAGPALAQSLFATRGLGTPIVPVDARSRALGGIGIGLFGLNMSLVNPADVAGLARRGIGAELQPGSTNADVGGQSGGLSAARFPMMRIVYPVSSTVLASLGYGGLLEQSWGVTLSNKEIIGADTVDTTDNIVSTGGVAKLALGAAVQVSPWLSLGGAGGLYTGSLDRRVSRTFADSTLGLREFDSRLTWNYHGAFATLGFRANAGQTLRAGAAITLSQHLRIEGQDSTARDDRADVPLRVSAGLSSAFSSSWLATAGMEWNGGGTKPVFQSTDASAMQRSTWRLGGGLEYEGAQKGGRVFPLRVGGSWTQFPYFNAGESPASEWSVALGAGARLAADQGGQPLAVADVALERGGRRGLASTQLPGGLKESFWRISFSLSLFGQ